MNLDDLRRSLIDALTSLSSHRDYLNQLDQGLGDGDHGSAIARGADAAIAALGRGEFKTANAQFEAVGASMMATMGGASGILFGTWFRAARSCPPAASFDTCTFAAFLERGLQDLQRRSKASIGDKTMMDALIPATRVVDLDSKAGCPLAKALAAAAEVARWGAAGTVGMLPRFGRGTTPGERVRAAQDPGATSIALFLGSFATAAKSRSESETRTTPLTS